MAAGSQSDGSPEVASEIGELLGDVLETLVGVMLAAGIPYSTISRVVEERMAPRAVMPAASSAVSLGSRQRECMEVMCLWRRDVRFMTSTGEPRGLPVSQGRPNFRDLCEAADVHTNPEELMELLEGFGAIKRGPDDQLIACTPTFLLGPALAQGGVVASDGVLRQLSGFLRVLRHNLTTGPSASRARFERSCGVRVAVELVPVLENLVSERGQDFIDAVDEWLERQRGIQSRSGRYVVVGAGAYFADWATPCSD